METKNIIEFHLSENIEKKLDTIIELLQNLKPDCKGCVQSSLQVMGENLKMVNAGEATAEDVATGKTLWPETPREPQEEPKTEAVKEDRPAPEVSPMPAPATDAPAEKPKPTVTLDQIRQKVTYLRASGDPKKKDGAKDIILAYAPNITALANVADKWPEIWDKLTALEG